MSMVRRGDEGGAQDAPGKDAFDDPFSAIAQEIELAVALNHIPTRSLSVA
jgi:hypothetical protein